MTFEEALIEHCSPTLAGVKPASLFRFCPRDSALFARRFLALRQQFAARGLRLVILKGCRRTGSYLLYLYRERDLAEVLGRREHRDFLRAMGYTPWEAPGDCLRQLAARLCLEEEFPHEIGVFLGYPLDDVKGFIRHKGRDYTFCGCWKCYGDPQAARRRFERYHRCPRSFAAGMRREPRSLSSSRLLDRIHMLIQNDIQKGWINHG